MKKHPCERPGCKNTHTTPCINAIYRHDLTFQELLQYYGIRGVPMLLHLWRHGWVEPPPNYYCCEHAKEEGFCFSCGVFIAGGSDYGFDFGGQQLCENCRENDWWEDYYDSMAYCEPIPEW